MSLFSRFYHKKRYLALNFEHEVKVEIVSIFDFVGFVFVGNHIVEVKKGSVVYDDIDICNILIMIQ